MKFLAIDTASENLSVELFIDGKLFIQKQGNIEKEAQLNRRRASEVLFLYIDKVFLDANIKVDDLDFFAAVVGPGSFTGIRVGLAAVKVLSQFSSKPILSLNSLEVRAATEKEAVVSVVDASNGLLYVAAFSPNLQQISQVQVIEKTALKEFVKSHLDVKIVQQETSLTNAVLAKIKNQKPVHFNEIWPLYIRKSQAEQSRS